MSFLHAALTLQESVVPIPSSCGSSSTRFDQVFSRHPSGLLSGMLILTILCKGHFRHHVFWHINAISAFLIWWRYEFLLDVIFHQLLDNIQGTVIHLKKKVLHQHVVVYHQGFWARGRVENVPETRTTKAAVFLHDYGCIVDVQVMQWSCFRFMYYMCCSSLMSWKWKFYVMIWNICYRVEWFKTRWFQRNLYEIDTVLNWSVAATGICLLLMKNLLWIIHYTDMFTAL